MTCWRNKQTRFPVLFCVGVVNVDDRKKNDTLKNFLNQKGVSLLHQNVRGLLHNFTAIEELLYTHKNIDILTLSETHICVAEDNDKLYHVRGYNFEKRNRPNGKGGGVALYIKDSIDYIRRTDLESKTLENIVIEIVLTTSKNFYGNKFHAMATKNTICCNRMKICFRVTWLMQLMKTMRGHESFL